MDKKRVVYLEITSYIGLSWGAIHYYGDLVYGGPYAKVELEHKLTAREAARLNKLHDTRVYRAGSFTSGFDARQDIIDVALATYKQHFPQADILILGRSAVADPQKVLDGPADLKAAVNTWYEQAEAIGGYEGDWWGMTDISDAFWEYWENYK